MEEVIDLIQSITNNDFARSAAEQESTITSPPHPFEDYVLIEDYKKQNNLVEFFQHYDIRSSLMSAKGQQLITNLINEWLHIRRRHHCIMTSKVYVHLSTCDVKIQVLSLGNDKDLNECKDIWLLEYVMSLYHPEPHGFDDLNFRIEELKKAKHEAKFSSIVCHPSLWNFDKMCMVISSLDLSMHTITDTMLVEIHTHVHRSLRAQSKSANGNWIKIVPHRISVFKSVFTRQTSDVRATGDSQLAKQYPSSVGVIFYMRHCYAHLPEHDASLTPYQIGKMLYSIFGINLCSIIVAINELLSSSLPNSFTQRVDSVMDAVEWQTQLI